MNNSESLFFHSSWFDTVWSTAIRNHFLLFLRLGLISLLKPTGYVMHEQFNLLKPTGYVMHQHFNLLKPTGYVMHEQFNLLKPTGYVMHQHFNLLKPTGHVMHQKFNIRQLYALPTLHLCFVFIWEQTATCATYSINWSVFITEMKSVYCAVRTGSLNKAVSASYLKGSTNVLQ